MHLKVDRWIHLTLFEPMFQFLLPENLRKINTVFWSVQGVESWKISTKWVYAQLVYLRTLYSILVSWYYFWKMGGAAIKWVEWFFRGKYLVEGLVTKLKWLVHFGKIGVYPSIAIRNLKVRSLRFFAVKCWTCISFSIAMQISNLTAQSNPSCKRNIVYYSQAECLFWLKNFQEFKS